MANTRVPKQLITGLVKADVGLGNVDNTSDASKPLSTAATTALNGKAASGANSDITSLTGLTTALSVAQGGTGQTSLAALKTSMTFVKSDVGLGNVDNTADSAKPVSTAQQAALDLKAPLASPTFTGTVSGVTKAMVGLGSVDNTADSAKPVSTAQQTALDLKAPLASPTFTGTVGGITKSMVGLGNVDNTADSAKPVSTAQQTALDLKAPLASPALTGTPTAPTASAATNTTQIATTAMVQAAIASITGGSVTGPGTSTNNSVVGWNGTGGTVLKELTAAQVRSAATLDTTDSPQFTAVNVGHASDTTLSRLASGRLAVEGDQIVDVSDLSSAFSIVSNSVKILQSIIVAASDETTAITAGTAKVTFRMPHAFTLTEVRASLTTAQTSGSIFTVDINEAGATILSTKLTLDNTEKTSTTAVTAAVISDASLADDAEITIDVDQVGDGTAKGLKITLVGYRP